MPYLFYLAILALFALAAGAHPQHARADSLTSARTFLEMGKRDADSGDKLFAGLGVVADTTFGRAKPKAFRVGPAIELRTVNFGTLEAAAGATMLLPLPGELYIGLYGLAGAAARKKAPDGLTGIGKVTFGFRAYPYDNWYGYGLNVYGAGRKAINGDESLVEWSGGVEVDVEFTVITPLLFFRNLVTAHDPYEEGMPERREEDEEEAQDEPEEEREEEDEEKSEGLDSEKPPALEGDEEEE
ncbi:MAG TPA: hypothetical protein VFX59_00845 [Polyangiales bacterium]|nr:hypothetical protein [Polyangiales bacterium]